MLHDDYGVSVPTLRGVKDANEMLPEKVRDDYGNKTKMIHRSKGKVKIRHNLSTASKMEIWFYKTYLRVSDVKLHSSRSSKVTAQQHCRQHLHRI
jgi:hypothetical protein